MMMQKVCTAFVCSLVCWAQVFISQNAMAARHRKNLPKSDLSIFRVPECGVEFPNPLDFWDFTDGQVASFSSAKEQGHIHFVARAGGATLTFRTDDAAKDVDAEKYAHRYVRYLSKFGFEVDMGRPSTLGIFKGYELQTHSATPGAQPTTFRQWLVSQPTGMWVFTCSGSSKKFDRIWDACQNLLESARVTNVVNPYQKSSKRSL